MPSTRTAPGDTFHPVLVRVNDRISFLVLSRGALHANHNALEWTREGSACEVQAGSVNVLFLEPGVTISHAAVKMCADHGTLLAWVGEAGVHLYAAAGTASQAAGERHLHQAGLRLRARSRIAVARRLYARMLVDLPRFVPDVESMRGVEGSMVKTWYARIAKVAGVPWTSREAAPERLRSALGYATSTLYGLSHAVILAAGYDPAIGFIHTGDARSLVFDLADTVKFRTVVPAAFGVYADAAADVRSTVRRRCRDLFRKQRTIDTLFENLLFAMGESE